MSRTSNFMQEQIQALYDALLTFGVPVYEDEISQDEEKKLHDDYHCFVYFTDAMSINNDMKTISQAVQVHYYSEDREDLDERTVEIINALKSVKKMPFVRTRKDRLQKKDTEQYVDRVILTFARVIPYGNC